MRHKNNQILAALSADEMKLLLPFLRLVHTRHGSIIARPQEKIEHVYFPHGGILSLVVELSDGGMIETGMVGRDGVLGAGAALDDRISLNKVIAQVPGPASIADPGCVREIALKCENFRSLLMRHELLLHAQAQQSAACNATHDVQARMCCWLVRMHDLIGPRFPITHEYLSQMLGVRRTSVSVIAGALQQAGFIRYSRGNVEILDVDSLKESACECYEAVKEQYRVMLGQS